MPQGLSVSRLWLALVVAVFCVPLFFDLGRADTRDDEAIYSFAVDRLLETGDWLEPKSIPNDDWAFLEKPPLKFWIVAAPIRLGLLPDNEFGRRFWDALFGAFAFIYIFLIGNRLIGPVCGAVAVLILFTHEPLLIAHGLRSNNMEGPLFLAYCAGLFHYLAWAASRSAVSRRLHAVAVGLSFTLGFMTKFVAVLFLPLVLGVASLAFPSYRRRLVADWRLWLLVALGVLALVAPWFLWAHLKYGAFFWRTIFGDSVVTRFTLYLDPSHVQPWHFYFSTLWARLHDAHVEWLAVAGLLALAVQAVRRRSPESGVVLLWFVLPLVLISQGTSKLYHYAYPFIPPVALAIGYLCALAFALGPVVLRRAVRAVEERSPFGAAPWRSGPVRVALLGVAALALGIAMYSLIVGPLRLSAGGREVFKSSGILRPLVLAVVCSMLAGVTRGAMGAVVSVLIVSLLPLPAYRYMLVRFGTERFPIRAARDCVRGVQDASRGPGLYVDVPPPELPYPIYYHFRYVRPWVRAEAPAPDRLAAYLADSQEQRPILVTEKTYQDYWYGGSGGAGQKGRSPTMVVFKDIGNDVLLLLPGPYAACEADVRMAQGGDVARR